MQKAVTLRAGGHPCSSPRPVESPERGRNAGHLVGRQPVEGDEPRAPGDPPPRPDREVRRNFGRDGRLGPVAGDDVGGDVEQAATSSVDSPSNRSPVRGQIVDRNHPGIVAGRPGARSVSEGGAGPCRPGGAADGSQGWSERRERNPWTATRMKIDGAPEGRPTFGRPSGAPIDLMRSLVPGVALRSTPGYRRPPLRGSLCRFTRPWPAPDASRRSTPGSVRASACRART